MNAETNEPGLRRQTILAFQVRLFLGWSRPSSLSWESDFCLSGDHRPNDTPLVGVVCSSRLLSECGELFKSQERLFYTKFIVSRGYPVRRQRWGLWLVDCSVFEWQSWFLTEKWTLLLLVSCKRVDELDVLKEQRNERGIRSY